MEPWVALRTPQGLRVGSRARYLEFRRRLAERLAKSEGRNPRAEGNPKSEIRMAGGAA